MSTKIGSLLIEVASGVARVESDMKKISKILDSNTAAWQKMFNVLKVAASGWLAKKVFDEALQAMGQFAAAGLEGAEKLKEHADAAAEFKQRQAELNDELKKFAAAVIGPMLPQLNDFMILIAGAAKEARILTTVMLAVSRAGRDMLPDWVSGLGMTATAWTNATKEATEYAKKIRELEEQKKKAKEDSFADLVPGGKEAEEEYELEKERRALLAERAEETKRLKAEQRRVADAVAQEAERLEVEDDQRRYAAAQEVDRARAEVAMLNMMQSAEGRRLLLEDQFNRERALFENDATQKLAIEKRYTKAVNDIQRQRKDLALSVAGSMFGALGQAASVFFGQQSAAAKAFGVLEVIVNTQRAVMQAWAAYPPPFGKFMAAAAYIQGAASIASILKAGSGGSSVGSAAATPSSPSSQGSIPEPTTAAPADEPKMRETGKTTIIIQKVIGEMSWVQNNLVPLLEQSQRDRGWNVEVAA